MRRWHLASISAAFLSLFLASSPSTAAGDETRAELNRLYQAAQTARAAKDWTGFRESTGKALALRPSHTLLLHNMACAESLLGRPGEAAAWAAKLLDLSVDTGLDKDPDLAGLRASTFFPKLRKRLEKLREPIVASQHGFTLPERDLIPEGIAYDPVTKAFFVSSVNHGKILRRDASGAVTDFLPEGQEGVFSVLGLRADPKRRALWACTTALPVGKRARKEDEGHSALLRLDLDTGKLQARFPLTNDGKPHNLNDLTIDSKGTVYTADGDGSGVYRLAPEGKQLEPLVAPGTFGSPQGLALSADERLLYVADYAGGISVVDVKTGTVRPLAAPVGATLLGIDGLLRHQGALIAIQNGVAPHRVVRLDLAADGAAIARARILEMSHPAYDEPTLGVLVGDSLYYVADSHWGAFDESGKLRAPEKLAAPVILKLPISSR